VIAASDTAAPKPYDEAVDTTRPRLHVMPPSGWLNDPNGLSRIDGTYHVFYQYNPKAPVHDNVHWGHASSTDLLTWTDEPIALTPRPGGLDAGGCWSGCVVDDGGVPTAVYTAVADTSQNAVVALARSDRTLRAWEQDPVGKIGAPDDPEITDVRDPFVFRFGGHRYAVQGAGHRDGSPQLLLYACDDLAEWTFLGPLLTADDPVAPAIAPANIWECPNLFRLGERWVLVLSLWQRVDDLHELAGVRYLLGDLVEADGGLRFEVTAGGDVDTGPTFYAPQVLVESDRVLVWGWAWEGAQRSPEEVANGGWAGVLTFPRELSLVDGVLVSRPAAELVGLRGAELVPGEPIRESAFEVVSDGPVELALIDPTTGLRQIAATTTEPARILVDASIVEVFGSGASETSRHYPTATSHWEVHAPAGYRAWSLG
jgi:beta-fructofuranosidase